jgi:hypothetical protein
MGDLMTARSVSALFRLDPGNPRERRNPASFEAGSKNQRESGEQRFSSMC